MRDRGRMNAICAFYENKKLDENNHKGDWKEESVQELWKKVREEFWEVDEEFRSLDFELAKLELADLINTSKMLLEKLHDVCKKEDT